MEPGKLKLGRRSCIRREFAKMLNGCCATYQGLFSFARAYWPNLFHAPLFGVVSSAPPRGVGLAEATYVFDPSTFIEGKQTRQMRYRPTTESNFSVPVTLLPEGRIETFKYRASELICEACGPDFRTAMIHTTAIGFTPGEPWTNQKAFDNQAWSARFSRPTSDRLQGAP